MHRLALVGILVASSAHAEVAEPPELLARRDALIERIARGDDAAAAVKEFAKLLEERAALEPRGLPTAITTQKTALAADQARAWREAYRKTADYDVSWRCRLSADPRRPPLVDDDMFLADWGRVVRKQAITLPPVNALAEPQPITLYEIAGQRRKYHLTDKKGPNDRALDANVGDLVLVCENVESASSLERLGFEDLSARVPPEFRPLERSGCSFKLARTPRIASKRRWDPIQVTDNAFFWAIKDVKWKYEGRYVLTRADVERDLGGGRYEIAALQGLTWVLEVPDGVRGREWLVPGRSAWVIAGSARFDAGLRKLVLRAEDIEARYVDEKP